MKLKTRLTITFVTFIVIPLVLTLFAFFGIGAFIANEQEVFNEDEIHVSFLSEDMQTIVTKTEDACSELEQIIDTDVNRIVDVASLTSLNKKIGTRNTFLIVRKGSELYYTGDTAGNHLFDRLTNYGAASEYVESGRYYDKEKVYIKQVDFLFPDGEEGSVFVVTKAVSVITKHFLVDMSVAIILILVFTSILLTKWIEKGVFTPIDDLNKAMNKITDGNFDYSLSSEEKGEIGELYRNYEDMRLRLKENTEETRMFEEQNRELISNISHDLKTPITAIKGYVEGIMDGVADTPERREKYLKTIYNKANDMERLINELTYYSRVDNNRIPYNFHRINVSDYFGDCIEEIGIDLEQRNISLNYSNMTSDDTIVIADPEQMKKVINNIISNSVKYMDKPKGVIDIRILDERDSICIEIEDNGKGISQKDLSKVFERFYRTDASRNSAQGGSGIGLSIVKKIIEDHGGYIWATAKEGEGTCIHFVLRKYIELNAQ